MSPVYAECLFCGVVEAKGFNISGARNVTLVGNRDRCPNCKRETKVLDGTFDFDPNGFARVLTGPDWTREAYAEAHRILLNAQHQIKGGANEGEVLVKAAGALNEVRPGLGTRLAKLWSSDLFGNTWAFLGFVVPLLLLLVDQGDNISEEDVARMLEQAVMQVQESGGTAPDTGLGGNDGQISNEDNQSEGDKPYG